MRVLFVTDIDVSEPYGSFTRPYYLGRHLHNFGLDVITTAIAGPDDDDANFIDLPCVKKRRFPRIVNLARRLFELVTVVKKSYPDIVCAHHITNLILSKIALSITKEKAMLVADIHGSWYMEAEEPDKVRTKISAIIEKTALRMADSVVVPSQELKSFFLKEYGTKSDAVTIIPNGVDNDSFFPLNRNEIQEIRERMGFQDKTVILMIAPCLSTTRSNILAIKFAYKMMPYVKKRVPNAILLIVGGGKVVGTPPDGVVYAGFVKNLNGYINCADVTILPYPREAVCGGARNKLLQYWICKIPVVSTREGVRGVPEAVPDVHFILAEDSPSDFAEKIFSTLRMDDRALRNIMCNAYQLVVTKYNWRKSAQLLYDKMVTLLGDSRSND